MSDAKIVKIDDLFAIEEQQEIHDGPSCVYWPMAYRSLAEAESAIAVVESGGSNPPGTPVSMSSGQRI